MTTINLVRGSIELAKVFPLEAIVVGLEDTSKQAVIAALIRHPDEYQEAGLKFVARRIRCGNAFEVVTSRLPTRGS